MLAEATFSTSLFSLWCIISHLFLLSTFGILSILSETIHGIQLTNRSPLYSVWLEFFTSEVDILSVLSCWRWFHLQIFQDQMSFPLCHSFRYIFKASTLFKSQSVTDGCEFFKPESIYTIMAWHFPIQYFLECCSELFQMYIHFRSL